MAVWSDQHRRGSGDLAEKGQLPGALVLSVVEAHPRCPTTDIEAARVTEVQQHRPGLVQQREHTRRAFSGVEVEVGHPPTDQWMPLADLVVHVETGDHRCNAPPRLL